MPGTRCVLTVRNGAADRYQMARRDNVGPAVICQSRSALSMRTATGRLGCPLKTVAQDPTSAVRR